MAHKTLIGGTAYEIDGGKTLIGGTSYEIDKGKTLVGGTAYDVVFVNPVAIRTLAVGSSVFMDVNGVRTEFLVVHHGKPSSMYDNSCDGTWLMMKALYCSRLWNSSENNIYPNSDIHAYLNNDFFNLLDTGVRSTIKTVKIPYVTDPPNLTVASGSSGLETKIFLPSMIEVGMDTSPSYAGGTKYMADDGAKLDYFTFGKTSSANAVRIAYLNGVAFNWHSRTPYPIPSAPYTGGYAVSALGGGTNYTINKYEYGVRPTLIVPGETLINDKNFNVIV